MRRLFVFFVLSSIAACGRDRPAPDAGAAGPEGGMRADAQPGITAVAGAIVMETDALAKEPVAAVSYSPRLHARLAAAHAKETSVPVNMPAGLALRVHWATRDDVLSSERYLTKAHVTVERLPAGGSCTITKRDAMPERRAAASDEAVRIDLSIDYVCVEGKNRTTLALPIGIVSAEGFRRIGVVSNTPQPLAEDAGADDGPAVLAVHFDRGSAALDAAATKVLDQYVAALGADELASVCIAFYGGKDVAPAAKAIATKRQEVVRNYLVDRGVVPRRVAKWAGAGQSPPQPDDIELWPAAPECTPPKTTKRR